MNTVKPHSRNDDSGPSTFALLVDDINKMTESEQKLLWIQLNKKRLSSFAKEIDTSVAHHNLSADEIDALIDEAKSYGREKKEG